MTEICVRQRSEEWFELRSCVALTASRFGEALGVGRGRPYDFLYSIVQTDQHTDQDNPEAVSNTRHGIELEPVIDEAYQLLTGNTTQETGFWIPQQGDPLFNLIGVSPDAKVMDCNKCVGLAEYKAPVFKMYSESQLSPHGIPRCYMAQIQGQLGVCGLPWCDFMAVCTKTREITLKRVHFSQLYWKHATEKLKTFCTVLQEANRRKSEGLEPLHFPAALRLQREPVTGEFLSGEQQIRVENLLQTNQESGLFRSGERMWMTYDLLMGVSSLQNNVHLNNDVLDQIDRKLRKGPLPK